MRSCASRGEQQPPILCQGRGSAANSAVCYALGVTAVDPAQHDLLFERFISLAAGEPPDIDIDFEHDRREEVIQHLYARYGRERAAICATIIRYRARSAIREVGSAMGLTADMTARLAKASWGPGRERGFLRLAAAEGLELSDPRLTMAMELAEELIDFPRHAATHVGGFVITRGPLVELAVVTGRPWTDRTSPRMGQGRHRSARYLEGRCVGTWDAVLPATSFDLLREHKRQVSICPLPKECPETYAMLCRADSVGVFQVESRAQMNMLPRLQAEHLLRSGDRSGDRPAWAHRRATWCILICGARPGWSMRNTRHHAPEFGAENELHQVLARRSAFPVPGTGDADRHRRRRDSRPMRPTSCAARWRPSRRMVKWSNIAISLSTEWRGAATGGILPSESSRRSRVSAAMAFRKATPRVSHILSMPRRG